MRAYYITDVQARYAEVISPDGSYARALYHPGFRPEFCHIGDQIMARPTPGRGAMPILLDTRRVMRPPDKWPTGTVTAVVTQNRNGFSFAQDASGGNFFVPVAAPVGSKITGRVEEALMPGAQLPRLMPEGAVSL